MEDRRIKFVILAIGICALAHPGTAAAGVTFEARVDRTQTTLDEPVTYTLEISGEAGSLPSPTLPAMDGFNVYSSGRTQSFSLVNGRMSSSVIFNYVLVPKKTGTLTIGPATIAVDGQTYSTSPITITVTGSSSAPPPAPSGRGQTGEPAAPGAGKRQLFIEAELDRDTVYVNQSVTLSFRFYQGERLYASPEYTPPSLAGFWKEDLPPQRKSYRTINGVRYDVTEIQMALFPISSGVDTIGEFRLTAAVEDNRRRSRDPFNLFDEDFFSVFRQGKPITLATRPQQLVVLPLPALGRPDGFSGLVGAFDISVQYDRTSVAINEPITAKVMISGRGNVKSITEPKVDAPADFRLYNAGSTEDVSKTGYRVSGSKTFEEVFVPRRAGSYELPGFTLTYFDPERKQYITRRTQLVKVTVTPGEGQFSIPPLAGQTNEVGYLAKDIRFLKTRDGGFTRQSEGFPFVLFGIFHLLPLIGLGAVVIARRHRDRLESDTAYRRFRYAGKTARRRFEKARKFAEAGNAEEFYPAVAAALTEFFGDQFNRSGRGITRPEIAETFDAAGVGNDLKEEFIAVLEVCDQARFAPGAGGAASIRELYHRAVEVLGGLEKARQNK